MNQIFSFFPDEQEALINYYTEFYQGNQTKEFIETMAFSQISGEFLNFMEILKNLEASAKVIALQIPEQTIPNFYCQEYRSFRDFFQKVRSKYKHFACYLDNNNDFVVDVEPLDPERNKAVNAPDNFHLIVRQLSCSDNELQVFKDLVNDNRQKGFAVNAFNKNNNMIKRY